MPIYEYVCLDCGKSFETLVLSTGEQVACPDCDSKRLERAMSAFAMAAKDGGKSCSPSSGFS